MLVWLNKMVLAQQFLHSLLRLVKKAQQSLTPTADWVDSLIGPGELLLVVSHQLAVAVLVLWVGLEKNK